MNVAHEIQKRMIPDVEKKMLPPALELFSLEGKTAIITGASSGLGREIAIGYAMAGAQVMMVARGLEKLEALKAELEGFDVEIFAADVSNAEDVRAMVAATVERFGKIDILVNNAGTTRRGPIVDYPDEEYDRIINVNMRSAWLCQKYVGEQMLKRGQGGSIINIGSGGGHDGKKHSVPYGASKGGMVMLSRGAAIEWAEEGIRVNIVMPGTFKTPLFAKCIENDPNYVEKQMRRLPIGRFGEPQEIVGICIFLACDNSAFMTGGVIFCDGGGNAQ